MNTRLNVAVILGSAREGRFCDTVAHWVGNQIARTNDFAADTIDPAALALPGRHRREVSAAETYALRQRIGRADAFIVVTPEYNHGYPAALKFLIDSVYEEWRAKPVAFVSYGGISGGLRAVEQLRLVFAELHTVTIRDTVSFAYASKQFDAQGQLLRPAPAEKAMAALLAQLKWWARALRDARLAETYGQEAA
ncbi:MAG TPA: NAD(P)H-dependent oxidoreductase [Burkholderiales bacterium]|nr:NAD(P)H-dependent oxidoreductase [Burkholderiales bacterium]